MSDRLTDLRRQRALVQEQLAWLDREIAALDPAGRPADPVPQPTSTPSPLPASPVLSAPPAAPSLPLWPAPGPTVAPPRTTVPSVATPAAASSGQPVSADAILNEYRVPADTLKNDIRKGCLLYFFGALALLAAGIATLWVMFRSR